MRRSSSSLPLLLSAPLVALLLGACSTSGDVLGPTPGSPGIDSHGGDDDQDAGSEGDDGSGDGDTGSNGGSTGGGGEPEPEPTPDDDDGGEADEPEPACDLENDVALWISPDDSNSMASPVLVREAVLGGWGSVQSVAIRTWEFFNYYRFDYPAAEPGSLALHAALAQPEDAAAGEFLLQVGVSSELVDAQARAPINVTLVLDTSGSMEGDAMDMLKETCHALAASLLPGDVVSIVTWNTENAVVLGGHAVSGPDDPELLAKIDGLSASGGTDLHAGLVAGYELAQQSFASDRINRVVLMSDGGANAGITDIELIAQYAGLGNAESIYLVGVGVGDAATYRDELMDAVTDAGKGAAVFVASPQEAWSAFHDDFVSTMAVAARDVQVRLDMPPGFELVSTSAEEVSTDVSDVEPQHLAPNDAMVFHQRIRSCAPTELTDDATITVTVIWIDALTFRPRQVQRVYTLAELFAADRAPLYKGAAVLAYADGLKAYKLADSEGRVQTMSGAFEALALAEAALPGDPELAEIRQVLEALTE